MLKTKYLHRRTRTSYCDGRKYNRGKKNLDLFSDKVPLRESIGKGYRYSGNFSARPMYEFIESKIGQNWDDVYSEILTKIDKRYRQNIDLLLFVYNPIRPIYDDYYVPRSSYGNICVDRLYIDLNNIISKRSEDEILIEAKRLLRKEKLRQIFKSQED